MSMGVGGWGGGLEWRVELSSFLAKCIITKVADCHQSSSTEDELISSIHVYTCVYIYIYIHCDSLQNILLYHINVSGTMAFIKFTVSL
jgi:hypothetical protein